MRNLIGLRFGNLLVVERGEDYIRPCDKKKRPKYKCLCDCGNTIIVRSYCLPNGNTISCGCYRKELITNIEHEEEKLSQIWFKNSFV